MIKRAGILLAGIAASAALLAPGTAVAAPAAAATPLPCRASVSNAHPRDYTTVKVYVTTAARASVTTTAHYRTTNTTHHATASATGHATVPYYISRATPGYRVAVSVRTVLGSRSGSCSTSFTPVR